MLLTLKHWETLRVFSVHHTEDTAHKAFFVLLMRLLDLLCFGFGRQRPTTLP